MKKNSITFSVQMTVKDIYRFTMYHIYHGMSGRIGLLLSFGALINLILSFETLADQTRVIMIIIALWYTIFEPITMLSRAKSQKKRNKAYQQPLDYCLDEAGITVSQGEQKQTMPWENLQKVVETRTQYLLYTSKVHACIFQKSALKGECEELEELIVQYAKDMKICWKGSIKRRLKG